MRLPVGKRRTLTRAEAVTCRIATSLGAALSSDRHYNMRPEREENRDKQIVRDGDRGRGQAAEY